ncbi:MAG: hypothetical protein LC725_07870 [Lentisphaerae bacterium]|nr:hypothetical protein [Lentisphaerota bacterium]
MAKTKRAWPLLDVARMFLKKPAFYAVKIESPPSRESSPAPADLFQCTECQQPFQTRVAAVNHTLARHFEAFFAREEQQAEPPKGDFAVVARCGLSGVLLGPPNYHLYNEKIAELHRTRFADMTMDAYRRHIVNEADPDLIEKWRQEAALQVTFRSLREPQELVFNRSAEAEAHFMNQYAPTLVREGRRVIIPGMLAQELEDAGLMQRIRQVWMRESRSPVRMTLAVRPAFRQLGLHMFRDLDKTVFVTSIVPKALPPVQAAPAVTFILDYLAQHPHAALDDLARGWAEKGESDAVELKRQLHWLIDKGHVVEYYNSTLSIPPGDSRRLPENDVPTACPADTAAGPETASAPS